MNTSTLIQKVWNFCHTLRDDGVSYGDYLEQLTYLLFLKMADEYAQEPYNRKTHIPKGYDWASLRKQTGEPLEAHYLATLHKLGQEPGMLGAIFFKAQNKIQDPAKLSRLVQMIDEQDWVGIDVDTKGDLYEGLLQKNAEDTKSGAGQYFTPRAIIRAMVECLRPAPGKVIADPACGTGGFFLGAYNWLTRDGAKLNKSQKEFLRDRTFHGNEIVPNTRRLCLMNLFLHNIGDMEGEPSVERSDALIAEPKVKADYVLANPPFGKKSSMTITNEDGEEDRDALTYERQDFWETTSNKQLNFLQHIVSMLKVDGKAAVVLPDNVLFEGGAGEKIRRKLLETCDVHTILRLPTGIFYAQGVKANVVFFDNAPKDGRVHTEGVWFYDLRTNKHFTLKTRTLKFEDLEDFMACYNPENRYERKETEKFKYYRYKDLIARDKASLDIFWLKDESMDNLDDLPPPDVLQQEIIEHLEAALSAFRDVASGLPKLQASVVDIDDGRRILESRRSAIACYVVDRLANQKTFGRTKKMKALYLAECHLGLDLGGKPMRHAAGPYDPWINEFEEKAIRTGWFDVEEKDIGVGRTKVTYRVKSGIREKLNEAHMVLGDQKEEFDRVLGLLAGKPTEEVEAIATLFGVWNDALLGGVSPSDDEIVREVRENWHPEKAKFSPSELKRWLDWIRKHALVPKGKGPHTRGPQASLRLS